MTQKTLIDYKPLNTMRSRRDATPALRSAFGIMSNRWNSRGRQLGRRRNSKRMPSTKRFATAATLTLCLLLNESSGSSPTAAPTPGPSSSPTWAPTKALYYPDWSDTSQSCVNSGKMPDYMLLDVQSGNFLFENKQECCLIYFPWRVRQCMGSNDPVYYRDGTSSTCIIGETQDKYDVAFDSLEECCKEQVWWDEYGCIQSSAKVLEFKYTIDLPGIVEPTNCQDAHIMATRVQDAMAPAMPSGTTILVNRFGGLSIENDVAFGTIQCEGEPVGLDLILVHVFAECSSSGCTDDASVQSLFDSTFQSLLNYAQGSMAQDIVNAAGETPVVPQLQQIAVKISSMSLVENFKDPRVVEDPIIYATSLTIEGELSVTGFDSSSFDAAQKALAISFFQAALKTKLESEGFSYLTKVTSMLDGKIMYEIFITADSSSEAEAEASSIETSLAADVTRAAIVTNASSEASGSSIESAFDSDYQIDGNTETSKTEIPVAKLTIEGTSPYVWFMSIGNAIENALFDEIYDPYLEKAMYETLVGRRIIDEESKIKVTGRSSNTYSLTWEITLYVDTASNLQAKADSIVFAEDFFDCGTDPHCVAADVEGIVKPSLPQSTLQFQINDFYHSSTTGLPSRGWWPNWEFSDNTCKNGGKVPSYMNRSPNEYFSDSKRECCEHWFPYDVKGCVGPTTGGSTTEFFVPNWVDFNCAKKLEKEMDEWELNDTFGSLEECCKKRFSYAYATCCSAPGLDGCSLSTETLYFPRDGKCIEGSEGEMEPYELSFAEKSVRKCCTSNFWWVTERKCCEDSGGC